MNIIIVIIIIDIIVIVIVIIIIIIIVIVIVIIITEHRTEGEKNHEKSLTHWLLLLLWANTIIA